MQGGKQFCENKLCPVTSGQELSMLCHSPHTILEQCFCQVSSPMGTRAPLSLSRMPYGTGKSPILCLGMRKLQPLFIYLLPCSFPLHKGVIFSGRIMGTMRQHSPPHGAGEGRTAETKADTGSLCSRQRVSMVPRLGQAPASPRMAE